MKLTKIESAYIGGIIDAEGSLGLYKSSNYVTPRLQITNINLEFLKHIQSIIGGHINPHRYYILKQIMPQKQVYEFSLNKRKELYALLLQVESYLIIKRKIALAILAFFRERLSHPCLKIKRGAFAFSQKEKYLLNQARDIALTENHKITHKSNERRTCK